MLFIRPVEYWEGCNRLDATDYEIIELCLAGQTDAFSEIVTRYKGLVRKVIQNVINNESELSDLSQEVFLRIYRSLDRYKPNYRLATWIMRITTNVCRDWLRRQKSEPPAMENYLEASDTRSNPEEQHLENEDLRRIREAIDRLPDKYRIPLALFHRQGLSYRELEEVLNEPASIIKNRLYRARLLLRKEFCSKEVGL